MPFPENMCYVRYDFNWGNTGEIQTLGMWGVVTNEGGPTFGDWQEIVDSLAGLAVAAWVEHMDKSNFSSNVIGMRSVVYHYRQDHKEVLHRAEAAFTEATAWKGTAQGSWPPQNTIVASLYGYDPAGYAPQRARKRGRVYLPTPSPQVVDGSGSMTPGATGGWATMFKALVDELTSDLGTNGGGVASEHHWRPYVASVAGQMATQVTHIRVGNIIDTQRRRRAQLDEAYVDLPINT